MTAPAGSRLLLAVAAVAVGFAAADTYVVVLALPDMMAAVGISVDELHRAAPIVSGFLLGYVAMLPLVGRVVDLRGPRPVLVGCLLVFSLGSLVTLAGYDLASMVAGRFLQGLGAGGLVPATLALVAARYPADRRGVPLGVVGAVQELGSVLGPLYGALVLAVAPWQAIFAVNLVVGLVLVAAVRGTAVVPTGAARRRDRLGWAVAAVGTVAMLLTMVQPPVIATRVTLGLLLVPVAGESRWLSPLGLLAVVCGLVAAWRAGRRLRADAAHTDVVAAALLALALAAVVLAFATARPEVEVLSPLGPWLLLAAVLLGVAFVLRNRRSAHPLVPAEAVRPAPAWGALTVSLLVGAALIAALVDVPVLARLTVHPDSQLGAALVLVRLLVALPVGALLGGVLVRRLPTGVVAFAGLALVSAGFVVMAGWGLDGLEGVDATVTLVVTGLGFGLALAPVNAALLAATPGPVHGVASALLVVARMVGMLVGLGALTAIGLRRYYVESAGLPAPADVCGSGTQCPEYTVLLKEAGLVQLQTVFAGAAVCAALAAVLALLTLRRAGTGQAAPTGRPLVRAPRR